MPTSFRPKEVEDRKIYRTLVGTVVPRPIGWISTCDADGNTNIAPFSFFGVACVDPPLVHFAQGTTADGSLKDTANNIHETGEFVHNLVTEQTLEDMHNSSAPFPPGESEFDACDIASTPSSTVAPPRVMDSPVSFECSLHEALELGTHTLFIGEIQCVHFDSTVTTADGELDIDKFDGVGRLTAGRYATLESQLSLDRVKAEDFPKESN